MTKPPTAPTGDGRDAQGRFAKGNSGGPGNPHARRVGALRSALLEAVTEDDMRAIVRSLVRHAVEGDVASAREVLLRVLGRPVEADLITRIEALEEATSDHGV